MSKLEAERPCIVLCGTGSKGDAIPLSELSKEMVSRGFQCKVLSNADHQSIFEHPYIEFIPPVYNADGKSLTDKASQKYQQQIIYKLDNRKMIIFL